MANIKNEFKKKCMVCGKMRTPAQYYMSKSDFHADGRLPICSDCYLDKSLNDDRTDIDIERFQRVLQQCDKPYIAKLYKSTMVETEKNCPDKRGAEKIKSFIGYYMKNLNGLKQYRTMTYADSDFGNQTEDTEQQQELGEPFWTYGKYYSAEMFAYAKALYNYWAAYYPIRSVDEQESLVDYIHNCVVMENCLINSDDSLLVDCNNDVVQSIVRLKSMGNDRDADFADWYADTMTIVEED